MPECVAPVSVLVCFVANGEDQWSVSVAVVTLITPSDSRICAIWTGIQTERNVGSMSQQAAACVEELLEKTTSASELRWFSSVTLSPFRLEGSERNRREGISSMLILAAHTVHHNLS